MKQIKRFFAHGLVALMGIALLVLGCLDMIDSFWSGMGAALVVVGVLRIIRTVRLHQDESYRQKVETEASDERNRFIRSKAWAWTGYLYILTAAILSIVLRVVGQELLSLAASASVALMVLLYWIAFVLLRKKY